MNRRTPLVSLAAIVAASIALGAAPAATAASPRAHGHAAHAQLAHGPSKPVKAVKPVKPVKPVTKEDRRLALAKTLLTAEVARKDVALARVSTSQTLTLVDPTDADVVRAEVAADRANLVTLRSAVTAAVTLSDVAAVSAQVAQVRPETYNVVLGALLTVAKQRATLTEHQAQADDLTAQADALEAQGSDVSAVRAALDAAAVADADADAAATLAHDLALALTATSPVQARAAVAEQLAAIGVALVTANTQFAVAQEELDALTGATV